MYRLRREMNGPVISYIGMWSRPGLSDASCSRLRPVRGLSRLPRLLGVEEALQWDG